MLGLSFGLLKFMFVSLPVCRFFYQYRLLADLSVIPVALALHGHANKTGDSLETTSL